MYQKILPRIAAKLALLGVVAAAPLSAGPRISEPDTRFYGQIVQRYRGHEFVRTSGELSWTLQTSGAAAKEYHFTTQLAGLAGGRFSYQLRIPHQLLAYDLSVATNSVALPAGGSQITGIAVALDGQALTVMPIAVADLSLSPSSRARALRMDLELSGPVTDSDDDGLPDWWEDAHGLDKWSADDVSIVFATASSDSSPSLETATTFAQWRAALFPQDTRDLAAFGQDDADGDGISNLLEYAFDLDPLHPDPAAGNRMPRVIQSSGGKELVFRKRILATDLVFHVDVSRDLISWSDASKLLQEGASAEAGRVVLHRVPSEQAIAAEFFRVRVALINP